MHFGINRYSTLLSVFFVVLRRRFSVIFRCEFQFTLKPTSSTSECTVLDTSKFPTKNFSFCPTFFKLNTFDINLLHDITPAISSSGYYLCDWIGLYKLTVLTASPVLFLVLSIVWGCIDVELVRNLVAHGDAREGKWRGIWRMECVASTLTPPPNVVYPALLKLMRTPRLPAFDWNEAPTDLNGLVRFGERRNLVSARVPSRSARAIRSVAYVTCTEFWGDFSYTDSWFITFLLFLIVVVTTGLSWSILIRGWFSASVTLTIFWLPSMVQWLG